GKPITEKTAEKVNKQLDLVVNSKKSHAMNYRIHGYRIGGKTGTAQVADPDNGGYVKGPFPYFVSFIGHAPSKNPKVIVYAGMSLAQKNKQEAYEMGASKAFNPIMENTLKYLNVGKNNETSSAKVFSKVPDVSGQTVQKAEDELDAQQLKPVVIGQGEKVTQQAPSTTEKLLPHSKVLLKTDGDLTMPDMKNWSKDDVIAFESLTGINVKMKGSGFVFKQSVSPNESLKGKKDIEIELSAPDAN
ncbi:penicillin-binding transpeptidase domain-containing protein, partial [Staphylococcus carnosus]